MTDDAVMDVDNQELRRFELLLTYSETTPEQRRGAACVWCSAPLAAGAGVDLGFAGDSFRLHSCRECRTARVRFLRTFFAWLGHVANCSVCEGNQPCADSDAMQNQHLAARRQAGKGAVVCGECGCEVSWAHRFRPNVWAGESSLHLLYGHAGPCGRPVVRAPLM